MTDSIPLKKNLGGRPKTSDESKYLGYKKFNDIKKLNKILEQEEMERHQEMFRQEMGRQEKINRIDAIRKSIVGFIMEKTESGEPVNFSNNLFFVIPTNIMIYL